MAEPNDDDVMPEQVEAALREFAVRVPEHYTHVGLAHGVDGIKIYVAGPDMPAMYWDGRRDRWTRIVVSGSVS